jgi:U3 small nucleolar RNA-associated protein 6
MNSVHTAKRQKVSEDVFIDSITASTEHDILERFLDYGVVYVPNAKQLLSLKNGITWKNLSSFFQRLNKDRSSWTHETVSDEVSNSADLGNVDKIALDFLSSNCMDNSQNELRGYCSFIIQHDANILKEILERLPMSDLPLNNNSIRYGPGLWVFFGLNKGDEEDGKTLEGRGEHTDSVSHDGTWHYQLSGCKDWFIRPTNEMLQVLERCSRNDLIERWKTEEGTIEKKDRRRLQIRCRKNDVLLLNTRLWWHQTQLPPNPEPSVSYARDIYLQKQDTTTNKYNKEEMTNIDGLYAAENIDSGTIIFRESEMPDCELHRTKADPNCELIELEDGEGAIVSCRNIKAGEFFCILESDDDYESGDEDQGLDDSEEDYCCQYVSS